MAEQPQPIQRLDEIFGAARLAHEYVADRHRELVELDADDDRSRRLLAESAAVVVQQMPRRSARLRRLAGEWAEHDLLDPQQAERTAANLASALAHIEPALSSLLARQRVIASELTDRVQAARRT